MNGAIEFDGITAADFSADAERRTLTGVVVPWGRVGRHRNGRTWRFKRGSLKYGHAKYIRLNDEHSEASRLGRAIAAEDTDEGLVMTFKVYDGAEGDKALALAGEGRKTGFSVEIEFDETDSTEDPENPGALLVGMANLTAVAFVRNPAFDDARLISVRANEEGTGMDPETTTTEETPAAVAPPVTLTAEQFSALMGRRDGADDERPAVIDPTGGAQRETVQVSEPLPYRFSHEGGRHLFRSDAEHDFSTDLFVVMDNRARAEDRAAAEQRVNGFIRAAFADVESADVTALNPNRHRPDLWQPQIDYATPLWEMVNSGDTDGRKFDVPKFDSSSGLVTAATEKVEPAAGSYVADLQTITPTQVWGKVEITRQAWRAGGSPQLSGILWDQMLREYYEDREAAVATFLATLTAADDIALPYLEASPDNDDLQEIADALERAITSLQFVRGGNRFSAFAVHQDLYQALAAVKDDAGRPLYPQINAQNANGTAASLFRTLNIAGVTAVGAWALGAGGQTSSVNSWMFDPAKVRGWASAPERLFWDFGATVQTANLSQLSFVTLGIYGDVAFANLDINGVRQVTFDPVS